MKIDLKKDYVWSLVVPTSMGIRITPANGQPVHCSNMFHMQATSAETNVASISSYLGLSVKVLTTFVKDSPIARFIKDNLASRHITYEGVEVEQGGPWGYRHQFNIADSGYGSRGPRVQNDRAGEVGKTLNVNDFDLQRLFGKEGVQILHLSGLIAALSPETSNFCLELASAAKKYGTRVSFDLNYRATFWKNREKELARVMKAVQHGLDAGLQVNAGHGLNYINVLNVASIQGLRGLYIGHSIISMAIFLGLERAVRKMKKLIKESEEI